MTQGNGGQNKVPRQTAGNAPAAPAQQASQGSGEQSSGASSNTNAEPAIPRLGSTQDKPAVAPAPAPQQDTSGGDTAVIDKTDRPGSTLTAADEERIAAIASKASAEIMERFFERMQGRSQDAKNTPVNRRHGWDAAAEDHSPERVLNIPVDGDLSDVRRTDLNLEAVDMGNFEDHAAELAFQREFIKIIVHETGDPNEQAVFSLSVNGVPVWITRGEELTIRRCYVELLFRAKPETVKVQVGKDPSTGDVVNRTTKKSALKYPFTIIHDPNPRGRRWREKMSHEG